MNFTGDAWIGVSGYFGNGTWTNIDKKYFNPTLVSAKYFDLVLVVSSEILDLSDTFLIINFFCSFF